jgi:restriction system protein
MNGEATFWGIHAGKTGDADTLFQRHNCVALGWARMGDLSLLPRDREAFKAKVAEAYPERKPGAIPNNAGQLFRFVHEMRVNDLVIYPSKRDKQLHFGRVLGPYRYDPSDEPAYPNRRIVEWIRAIPRTAVSQGALYEIGSAMSLFQVKNYAEEFRTALEGRLPPVPVEEEESLGLVADEIEETTRDFVLKQLSQELKGHPFAAFVAHVLNLMGYRTRVSPEGPDGGVDIVAHKDELGFEPPIIKVQVKSTSNSIGDPEVSSLYGKVGPGEFGLFVVLGTFTRQAVAFARGKSNLRLIDGREFVDLTLAHYDELDPRYKGVLPLTRVFVPEALEASE